MSEKSEAMRLAAVLDDPRMVVFFEQRCKAAAELRRLYASCEDYAQHKERQDQRVLKLHAQRDALLAALKEIVAATDSDEWNPVSTVKARAAIAAVEEGK